MRVVSGKARGLILKTIEENSTRPTKDMVKEALFSIIAQHVPDSIFLDLFAGSGAVGIEAISRGAEKAYFCDNNPRCIQVINENLTKAKFNDSAVVICDDYKKMLGKIEDKKFDIIFIDPPYSKELGITAIELISKYNILNNDGIIILENDKVEVIPDYIENFEKFNTKKYGRNILNLFKRKG
jgi:16S rRNA (guanine(966)-N(2))-methyltransferase RsmD